MLKIIRATRYPSTSCRKPKLVSYASPGTLIMVSVLVSAATMESAIAHHGASWLARK